MTETFDQWQRRATTATLLLWQKGLLSDAETLRKLCELSWTPGEADRLMQGAYLLLPTA